MKTVLIMGLPGSGKTYLAESIVAALTKDSLPVEWFNADQIRAKFNDWDFSVEGRQRQMTRMRQLADDAVSVGSYAICDFVCPTKQLRNEFSADFVVWMNTIECGRFEDTNKIFEPLVEIEYDVQITSDHWWNKDYAINWTDTIIDRIKNAV